MSQQTNSPNADAYRVCPNCGQFNAWDNTTCVVCKTPLDQTALYSPPPEPTNLTNSPPVSTRERSEIIDMYIRWCDYSTWLFGLVPFLLGFFSFAASLATGSFVGLCITGPITAASFYILITAPRVKTGLKQGETWPYDIIIKAHKAAYAVLGLMMLGLVALWLEPSSHETQSSWKLLLCVESPLIVGIIINGLALRAFEAAIGRRNKIRRLAPLAGTFEHPTGIKWYVCFLIFQIGIFGTILGFLIHDQFQTHADLRLMAAALVPGLIITALLVLIYGVWTHRTWARILGIVFHTLNGLAALWGMLDGLLEEGDLAGSLTVLGINLAILIWLYDYSNYFNR